MTTTDAKVIVITGASRGIGKLAAIALARQGHTVYATMRNLAGGNADVKAELTTLAEQESIRLIPTEMDVLSDESVTTAVEAIEAKHPIDILINNAGVMYVGLTEAFTVEQAKTQFDINFFAVVRTSRAILPKMRARESGSVIHISSNAGRIVVPFFGLYCASKYALEAYAESLHLEMKPFGVESILVEPGGHKTDLVEDVPSPADHDTEKSYGALAEAPGQMLQGFKTHFENEPDSSNAENVATAIVNLVETATPRPIRTTVGMDMGVNAINSAVAPVQAELNKQFGL